MTAPLDPLIWIDDVEGRLGETLADSDRAQVDSFIAYASALLRAHRPDIDTAMLDGSLSAALVKGVTVSAVVRAWDAVRIGLRIKSEQFPEITTTYSDANPSLLFFTADELASLSPTLGSSAGGAFSIVPG
jgi:hypothetical protein